MKNEVKNPIPQRISSEKLLTVTEYVQKAKEDGYMEDFMIRGNNLFAMSSENKTAYKPEEVKIINFLRFEGVSDPGDNSIAYLIETNDGHKGTLIDAFGPYADESVGKFLKKVQELEDKENAEKDGTNEAVG